MCLCVEVEGLGVGWISTAEHLCPQRLEEGIFYPGAEVTSGCGSSEEEHLSNPRSLFLKSHHSEGSS